MARMKIFNTQEEDAFESPPVFNSVERKRFFLLTLKLTQFMENLRTPTNKVCFLVMAGYFKSRHRFFAGQFRDADIEYIARQIKLDSTDVHIADYDRATSLRHQQMILDYFGYRPFDDAARILALTEIANLIRMQFRPKLVLIEVIQVLSRKKIELPSYNVLADLIVTELGKYQAHMEQVICNRLNEKQRASLDALLEKEECTHGDGWRYRITLLKKPFQSTQPSKIRINLADMLFLKTLYMDLKPILSQLGLSSEGIRYYAQSVIKFQIPQIARRADEDRYLHLIAFVVFQYFRLNDTLADTLLSATQATTNGAGKEQKEAYFQEKSKRNQAFNDLVNKLREDVQETLSTIRRIVSDEKLDNQQKVTMINATLSTQDEKPIPIEQQLDKFQQNAQAVQQGQDIFASLESRSLKLQQRVADIVRHIDFSPDCSKSTLWTAVQYYQAHDGNIDKQAPVEFLSPEQRTALTNTDGKFRVSLYKILLFIEISSAIRSGVLNLNYSEKYRSLDEYLIPKTEWLAHRDEYVQRAKLEKFTDCSNTLLALGRQLDEGYKQANENFMEGRNPYLTKRNDGTFHVSTPKKDEVECLTLGAFFPDRKYISMLEMLATVDHATHFLDEFQHWQIKYRREKPAKKVFLAGIMGYGCDIGHRKLAQISRQIEEDELENTVNWYFSLQNIQGANERILQLTDKMDLPNLHRKSTDVLHTSSDGQKFEVAVDSLNANYSFKYLGKEKGVSVITFIDMRDLMWHSTVISSSEREAAYVIDGLMHNDVIKSDIHSTDTHGYSEIIFASTYFLHFEFAPRIKGLGKQQLYAFKPRKDYEEKGYALLPDRCIREDLIKPQWDDMLRFIATIQLKIATASQLFKRLNSYSKQHPLYRALKEFGRITKTLFILKYRDDCEFRQAIEKQLNKVESSNKFSKAISFGHSHEFIQSEKESQEIAEACRRLIKNAIVCWNYLYLSRELDTAASEAHKEELIDAIRNGSAVTWQHFNLHGEFDFSDERMVDSVGLITPKNINENTM